MTIERQKQVETLYHAALELPTAEREVFVAEHSGNDDELRRAVESLLAGNDTTIREPNGGIAIGTVFGTYRIDGLLAQGGMGIVCWATDTKLNRPVAIKFLSDDLLDANARRRFQREAQMASALNHPHILTVYDAGNYDGRDYLVTEFVDGGTLIDWMETEGLRGWRQSVELLIGVADGIAAAHAANILHRDIKPANILISKSGYAKLADFGLAKLGDGVGPARGAAGQCTVAGAVIGTIAYMSPEQAAGRPLDARSDIFSFGVVLYELLAGRRPFTGATDLEILQSVIHAPAAPLGNDIPEPLRRIVEKAIEKDPAERYQTMRDFVVDLRHVAHRTAEHREPRAAAVTGWHRRPAAMIAFVVVTLVAVAVAWSWQRATAARAARTQIPEIARLVEQGNYPAAFERAQDVALYVRDDPLLQTLTPLFTVTYAVTTTPPDAEVLVRGYEAVDDEWQRLGRSPLADIPLPRGALRWRIEKTGFETAELATTAHDKMRSNAIQTTLHAVGTQASDTVFVPGGPALTLNGAPLRSVELAPFFIDRYEVTNTAYKEFVDAGGYERRSYWEGLDFSKEGQSLSWEEAMSLFVDGTGRSGPAGWELGDYPEGQDQHPVTGISWYEAVAYARYRGKSLPTVYHWTTAALDPSDLLAASIVSLSNFGTTGPAPVGRHQGLGPHGTYDMFGNVREWFWNSGPSGGWVIGGGWEDIAYLYVSAVPAALFERSPLNGVRLMQDTGNAAAALREPVDLRPVFDATSMRPVSDEIFAAYASQFEYRRGDLNATQPSTLLTTDDWIKQSVTIDAGYGGERMDVILFIPTRFEPPFQSVVYHPGAERFGARSTIDSLDASAGTIPLDFIIKSGRVFVYPIYQGTFSRWSAAWNARDDVRNVREWIERRSDLGRTIDYLETRADMDASRIGYMGTSLGASLALPLVALEPRLKAAVLLSGGFSAGPFPPSIDPITYASRIRIPVLMVNGRFDYLFPLETSQLPLFNQLGTAAQHKRHVILEAGHGTLPRSGILNETLDWLDTYLGTPVRSAPH